MVSKRQEIVVNGQIFILRIAEDADYAFAIKILKENMLASFIKHWGEWKDESFRKGFRKDNIRIIEFENRNVGYIDFKFKPDCGYVNNIQLVNDFKGKGLGTHIMKLLEKETLDHGLNRVCLKVFKDNNAVRLYERLSYVPIFEDVSSFIMEKKLGY